MLVVAGLSTIYRVTLYCNNLACSLQCKRPWNVLYGDDMQENGNWNPIV
jgi:hypothetical protein